ncbi:hypothetical protein CDD81_1303 [Ophiocordyceps australis]|uniref:Uncharacterized protein n=1 Tax=Ophiocordyceps australis TaxID=1399860 RepID=A0A2C5Y1G7_9HYPO|nr:hypothetical protein CDD81_1303 [Ophiocordyceps australis]
MVEQAQFIPPGAISDPPSLPGAPRSSSTSSYYSTTSPYSMASQCDTQLLTPVSSQARSPLLPTFHSRPADYPPPPGSPRTQGQTPPGDHKIHAHWQPQFDMNGTSHPTPHQFFVADERRAPTSSESYSNMYTMPDGEANNMHYLDQQHMASQNHVLMRPHLPGTIEPPRHTTLPPSGTLFSNVPFHRNPRRFSSDVPSMRAHAIEGPASPGPSTAGSPRRVAHTHKVKKRQAKRPTAASRANVEQDPAEDHRNCFGQETPPMLKNTCPEEERCIFESRWRHRHHRGQDMWDKIQQDFNDRFGKTHNKEMLQMKFKRARAKYIIWHDRDTEILLEAFSTYERRRYHAILEIFLEMGGSRNMRLNAGDIEIKLVNDLKLEDCLYIEGQRENMEIRRRRKVTSKKRQEEQGPASVGDGRPTHNEDDVIDQVLSRPDQQWDTDSAHSEPVDVPMWDTRAPMKMPETHHMIRLVNDANGRNIFAPAQ